MAEYAKNLIKNNKVTVTVEVIAEIIYVMNKVYKQDKYFISKGIIRFMKLSNIVSEQKNIIITALQTYSENKLDFVDCILYAYHKELGYEICTFDKKLNKLIEKC